MMLIAFSTFVALASPLPPAAASPAPRTSFQANDLYSHAERRRIAAYLRLRMLELHRAQLDGLAETLRRRLQNELDPEDSLGKE